MQYFFSKWVVDLQTDILTLEESLIRVCAILDFPVALSEGENEVKEIVILKETPLSQLGKRRSLVRNQPHA